MATEKRLIDANELMDDKVWLCGGFVGDPYCDGYMEALDKVETVIREFPTVEAVEVVHGRWVIEKRHTVSRNPYMDDNYHAHATCSECDFCIDSSNDSFGFPKLNTTNYCPNCGADMREKE